MEPGWIGAARFGTLPLPGPDGAPAVPPWGRRWVTGNCYDFALALLEWLPDGVPVGLGSADEFHHVGIRHGGMILDVRGELDEAGFRASHPDLAVVEVPLEAVELHAGLAGSDGEWDSEEMDEAREAVLRRFPGLPDLEPGAAPAGP